MTAVCRSPGIVCVAAAVLLAAAVWGPRASAADSQLVGSFKDWSAHRFTEKGGRVCYLYSAPNKSAGEYAKRGDTYVQVTHRTSDGTRDVVSITAGYTFRKGSEVVLTIDGRKFVLFTHDDTAWAGDSAADAALVAAMRAGLSMVVQGVSSRGTATTDTYSLSGFTAAHSAIGRACAVR